MVSRIRVHRSTNKGLYYTLEIHAQHTYALICINYYVQ